MYSGETMKQEPETEVNDDKPPPLPPPPKSGSRYTARLILPVEAVTKAMIENIFIGHGSKSYDREIGTSCHECRQKSTDQKTCCRDPKCRGVRGQFCGSCLMRRYGQCP
ncbi:hypothetical protein B566_EDAN003554, partial [Ephemera danica]